MGGHGGGMHKTRFHSVSDVPDELVQTWSKRDPNNPMYQTRKWVNMKKQQILYNQKDGVPLYLRTPKWRLFYYGNIVATVTLLGVNIYYFNYYFSGKAKK